MHLMALYSLAELGNLLLVVLMVAAGLGFVIFVHELGHFLVAKLCGVKCEKFYLGFDIGGLKIAHFRWGETEYGIGILPLGGYVKMLGQDDNPSGEASDVERARHEELDPRSYKAKSVPKRMAIISAGVIMNLIFACVMAAIAYGLGVKDEPAIISGTIPDETAWRAGLRPGDEVIQIGDEEQQTPLRFRDLVQASILSNPDTGVRLMVRREGVAEPLLVTLKPERTEDRLAPMIGAIYPFSTTLRDEVPVIEDSSAAPVGFKSGDRIVAAAGQPVKNYGELSRLLAEHVNEPMKVKVIRSEAGKKGETAADTELEFDVPPNPVKTLGLVMKMGPVTAIQDHSPAVEAGIQPGDLIIEVDGQPAGDPMTLPNRLRAKAGQTVELTLERESNGRAQRVTKQITPRAPNWWEDSDMSKSPLAVTPLGLSYDVLPKLESVVPNSPAAKATLKDANGKPAGQLVPGTEFVQVLVLPPPSKDGKAKKPDEPIPFTGSKRMSWPTFERMLQGMDPGASLQLTTADDSTLELKRENAADWFNPERGFLFTLDTITVRAHTVAQAARMGVAETRDSVGQVYGFLRRIGTRISPFGLGGPGAIAMQAGREAKKGISSLLIFLTMLSANLAVINFLPIPILDGGHMVFLLLEGILRRPVNERVVIAFHYAGFVFIISLMLFVLSLDVGLIPRH